MKKNSKTTLAVLTAGVILSLAARIFIIVKHTDMKTGFLYHGDEIFCNALYFGVIAIAMIIAVFTAVADEKRTDIKRTPADITGGRAVVLGLLNIITGVFAVYEGAIEPKAVSPSGFLLLMDYIFGAFAVVMGIIMLIKRRVTAYLGFMYVIFSLFSVCRCLYNFTNRMVIITVPEYLIESLSMIVMAVFFALLAKYLAGFGSKSTKPALCFWGVGACALMLSSALGTIIASFAAPEEIRRRIVFSAYEAESFKQASAGVEYYMLTAAPWVEFFMGIVTLASLAVVFMKAKEERAEQR